MQLELTRELLERYLRATGWHRTGDVWARHGLEFTWISTKHVNHIVANIRQAEGTHTNDLIFRLGLCAAAESRSEILAMFRAYHDKYDRPRVAGEDRGYNIGKIEEIEQSRDALLRAAGIDPAAWEAAR